MSTPPAQKGSVDPSGHQYHRRMAEQKLQSIADSALVKVLHYLITGLAIPLIGWGMTSILDRMGRIEDALGRNNTIVATYELRLQRLEQNNQERDVTIRLLTEKMIGHGYEIHELQQKVK